MQTPPPVQRPTPPVLLVNAHAKPPVLNSAAAARPLLEDKERLLRYGKWGGLAFLALIVLNALFGGEDTTNGGSNNASYSSSSGGSYEDRMNAGIAELGGTYNSTTGTMNTNR
jgi:hypothetical protein